MKLIRTCFPFLALMLPALFTAACPVFALEIIIEDSSGNIRHVSEVDTSATVRFQVNNKDGKPVDGALLTISRKESEESRRGAVLAGVAEFLDVTAGHWIVTSDPDNLVLAEVDVTNFSDALTMRAQSAETGGTISTASALGVAAIAGGITALGVSLSDDDDPSPSD